MWAYCTIVYLLRAHTAPLFTQLKILDIYKINTFHVAKFMFSYHHRLLPPSFTTYSLPVTKYIATILEVQTHIDPIYVKQILSSLQFFFKVPKSGIPCQMIF
jgi:hypothetical protein